MNCLKKGPFLGGGGGGGNKRKTAWSFRRSMEESNEKKRE